MICNSTHGGGGYSYGSYWDRYDIVCLCGAKIINPCPTGSYTKYYSFRENFIKWLIRDSKTEPQWPEWIPGTPGKLATEAIKQWSIGLRKPYEATTQLKPNKNQCVCSCRCHKHT
jgi:hypothetical protein